MRLLLAALAAAATLTAQAAERDVALPGNPVQQNFLLRRQLDTLYYFKCRPDLLPSARNCTEQVHSMDLGTLEFYISSDYGSELARITGARHAEVRRLKELDAELIALKASLDELEAAAQAGYAAIAATREQLTEQERQLALAARPVQDYDEQIAAVERRLQSQPNDQQLLALLTQLREERAPLQAHKESIEAEIARLTTHATELQQRQEATQAEQRRLTTAYGLRYDSLVVSSPELDRLDAQTVALNTERERFGLLLNQRLYVTDVSYRFENMDELDRKLTLMVLDTLLETRISADGYLEMMSGGNWVDVCGSSRSNVDDATSVALVACKGLGLTYVSHELAPREQPAHPNGYSAVYDCNANTATDLQQCTLVRFAEPGECRDFVKVSCH